MHCVCTILSSVACSAVYYSFTLSHKRINGPTFKIKKKLKVTFVVCFLCNLPEIFLFLRRAERDIVKNVHWSSYKVPNILVRFQRNLNFLKRILKNTKISIFVKILLVGAELFFADRRTELTKLIFAFKKILKNSLIK